VSFSERLLGRPPRWRRVAAVVLLVINGLSLFEEHRPRDIVEAVFFGCLMLTVAIAPRALYDGRSDAWSRAHPVLSGAGVALFLGFCLYMLLSDFLDTGLSLLIAVPSALGLSVSATWGWSRRVKADQSERAGDVDGVG
jgi:hypothetical protein